MLRLFLLKRKVEDIVPVPTPSPMPLKNYTPANCNVTLSTYGEREQHGILMDFIFIDMYMYMI
jgi:hypothetical protein